jgi:hypothetical protein
MSAWVGGWIDRHRDTKPGIQIYRWIRKIDSFQSPLNFRSSTTGVCKQIADGERKSARKVCYKKLKKKVTQLDSSKYVRQHSRINREKREHCVTCLTDGALFSIADMLAWLFVFIFITDRHW